MTVAALARQHPDPDRPANRRRATSVRARATLGAVTVLGLILVGCSVVLLGVIRWSYVESVRNPTSTRARDIVAVLDRGAAVDQLQLEEGTDRFTQILDGDRVVAASANARDVGPLVSAAGVGVTIPIGDSDDEWVVVGATAPMGRTVVVGRELDPLVESVGPAATALAIGLPLVLAAAALITWRVVGSALAPVEAIRREVASLGATDLARRVPVPVTDDEIEELAATMNRMLDRLDAAQRQQRRFVSDASHELRSPLSAIRQHAEVARAHPDRTSIDALTTEILAAEARLERLVDDLLLLARSDEGGLGIRPSTVDVDDLVLDEVHRSATGDRDLDVTAVETARVVGDEALLRRAIRNLVDNAARHAAGQVRVTTATSGTEVVVSVHDDGPGIPAPERAIAFERFVRLDPARSAEHGGAGLGLAIVAEVAAAHGGEVDIDDSPLGGAAVSLRLPATDRGGP